MAADLENTPLTDDQDDNLFENPTESSADADLEQYGVWVKVAPEDVVESTPGDEEFELENLSTEAIDEDALLTEEEEELLGSLEDNDDPIDSAPDFDIGAEAELGELSDIELDEPSMDLDAPAGTDEDLGNLADLALDADLPEMDFDSDLAELDNELDDLQLPDSDESLASDDFANLDLEEPDALLPGADEELNNIDLDDFGQTGGEEDLLELQVEDESDDLSADLGLDSLDADLDEGLLSLDSSADALESDNDFADEPMDDLASLEMDLKEDTGTGDMAAPSPVDSTNLNKIESELQSIKNELQSLKSELSSLKGGQQIASEAAPSPAESLDSGFLSEDEDETIALTGDELDNILNTADITEETVEESEIPDDQDLMDLPDLGADDQVAVESELPEMPVLDDDFLMDKDDIISMDGEQEHQAAEIELDEPELVVEELAGDLSEDLGEPEELSLDELSDEPELSLDDLDLDEPEVDMADQTETIDLEASDELLGEILSDDDMLGDIDMGEGETEELNLESLEETTLDLEDDDLLGSLDDNLEEIALEPAEDLELEEMGVEDFGLAEVSLEDDALELEETQLEEATLELEELSDDDLSQEPVEELELDIDSDLPDLEDTSIEELTELDVDEYDSSELLAADELGDEIELEEVGEAQEVEELELLSDIDDPAPQATASDENLPDGIKDELKSVLGYMDHLLESLPEDKIQEFAQSEHFEVYKKLFEELGLES